MFNTSPSNEILTLAQAELAVDPIQELSPPPLQKTQVDCVIKHLEVRQNFQTKLIDLYKELSIELSRSRINYDEQNE